MVDARETGGTESRRRVQYMHNMQSQSSRTDHASTSSNTISITTCLVSRAVHLEIAYGLDTDLFLNAFYRMTNRRGLPAEMLSDNGTNFVGGERELRELIEKLDGEKIVPSGADKGIKWNFNLPLASHFGEVHESMIKSAKKAIKVIAGNADVNDKELMTIFTVAESLLNS